MKIFRLSLGLLGVASLCLTALAAPSPAPNLDWRKSGPPDWATPADLVAAKYFLNLALFIGMRTENTGDVHWKYKAVSRVVQAAGVQIQSDLSPAEEEQVRQTWNRFEAKGLLVANNLQFDVIDGSLLKFAVNTQHSAFITFAAQLKLGLTHVDESDGRTVLDYVQYHLERSRGTASAPVLQAYYDELRKAGAKHRAELP